MTPDDPVLLRAEMLGQRYALPRRRLWQRAPSLQALQGVSFELQRGRSLGVVGESGSGKSTLARLVMALERPHEGKVWFEGQDLHALPPRALRRVRPGFQMVFQDPYGSLDPRRTIWQTVSEPLALLAGEGPPLSAPQRRERTDQALQAVGLSPDDGRRFPHEFSGGQRQRIAMARALITRPRLVVADEPVSALDVSVQAQVLNLLLDLQDQLGLSYLFISHDLAVIGLLCHDLIVLQEGRVVEQGPTERLLREPTHPYTRRLVEAVPGLQNAGPV